MSKTVYGIQIILPAVVLFCSSMSVAQHTLHSQAADSTGIAAETETSPLDDSVLDVAPVQLDLLFPSQVRLVKLTLHNGQRDWVDISFRYNPSMAANFMWKLPDLQDATYYTTDWAVLTANERLIKGSFSFAFGPGAEPPSIIREAAQLRLQTRYGDSDIRYVTPPSTEIIIDRDPPIIDPPFVIDLDEEDPDPGAD
ncbi:MAG: copper resistance protein CopC [Gammaproteobacteria bacterium]|nr:copper resistance protein CopC [Gammaproteobacteria bacterium]